jgi:hypothetical protein
MCWRLGDLVGGRGHADQGVIPIVTVDPDWFALPEAQSVPVELGDPVVAFAYLGQGFCGVRAAGIGQVGTVADGADGACPDLRGS